MTVPLRRLEVGVHGDLAVISLVGEIDLSNVAAVERELDLAMEGHAGAVVVLDALTYLDSAAIAALERLSQRRARLSIVLDKRAPIHRAVTVAGLDRLIPFYETLPAALA